MYSTLISLPELGDDFLDDDFAKVERIAHGLSFGIEKRKRRRILAIADPDRAALVDLLQRSRMGDHERVSSVVARTRRAASTTRAPRS